ncbi:MAG: WecB/TagA/CpsF family glycosyltransferase [Cyanobacteria bacterium Co-bin13]|nr:WecB/TagA/CpsF family glycosyltransferase [Cyanobacteria bacterium Co-bin13]
MGLPVHVGTDYTRWLMARLRQGEAAHVITLNAEMAMQSEQNPKLRRLIQTADLVIPDGSGVVLYFRLKGRRIQRQPGIELAAAVLAALGPNEPAFFYGGAPGVADRAAVYWQERLPQLAIAGTQHGFLSPEDFPAFEERLKALQPSIVFVGMGVPRQEFWIAEHRHLCPQAIWIGVGGSFDIWAGVKTRAPKWFCDNHLEWLYRLYQEPWRWRRMLALPRFAVRSLTYSRPRP